MTPAEIRGHILQLKGSVAKTEVSLDFLHEGLKEAAAGLEAAKTRLGEVEARVAKLDEGSSWRERRDTRSQAWRVALIAALAGAIVGPLATYLMRLLLKP